MFKRPPDPDFDPRIPLVIGVVGHCDYLPEAGEALEREVRGVFEGFRREYPNTPLLLLTPMAVGADRLVARVARKMGVGICVPLPWPLEGSSIEVPHGGSYAELREAIGDAETIVMPATPLSAELTGDELAKDRWEHCGAYVARHCQVLIALWDGEDHDTGTRRVVQWHKNGHPVTVYEAELGPLDRVERGPVYHVVTPRKGTGACACCVELKIDYPEVAGSGHGPGLKEHFHRIWSALDRYNSRVKRVAPRRDRKTGPSAELARTGSEALLAQHYQRADAAAENRKGRTAWTLGALFATAFAAFVFVEAYAHVWHKPWQLGGYLMLAAIGGLGAFLNRPCQRDYIDYRALAEGLRVAFYWEVVGLERSVADHYLRQFRSELDWIRHAIRNCGLMARARSKAHAFDDGALVTAVGGWIYAEIGYLERRARMSEASHHRCHRARTAFFVAGLAAGLGALLWHLNCSDKNKVLMVLVFTCAVLAGMAHEWAEMKGYEVDARRYQAAHTVFLTARDRLASGTANPSQIFFELGREALSESADWVIQHRQRPIGLPNI